MCTDTVFPNLVAYLDVAEPQDKISRIAAAMTAKAARREESHSALVPRKDGSSLEMVVARNAGEARNAKRDTKLVTQQRQWDKHALKVGKVHNSQKHVSTPWSPAFHPTLAVGGISRLISDYSLTVPRPSTPINRSSIHHRFACLSCIIANSHSADLLPCTDIIMLKTNIITPSMLHLLDTETNP